MSTEPPVAPAYNMAVDDAPLITRAQADEWAGEPLRAAIPFSTIPEAIDTIVNESIRSQLASRPPAMS